MKTNNSKFKIGVIVYSGILVVLIAILLIYTWNSMKKYEASQSSVVMDKLIESLEKGDYSQIDFELASKFENADDIKEIFVNKISGKELSHKLKSTSYDEAIYEVLCGEEVVATVYLAGSNHKEVFKILTICDWKLNSVVANVGEGTNVVNITVPSAYSIYVNDVLLGNSEVDGTPQKAFELEYVEEYTDIPTYTTYKVEGLINEPTIKVFNAIGDEVSIAEYEDYSNIKLEYEVTDMPTELLSYVSQAAKDYSDFFTKDLPGCATSTKGIDKYFPEGSMYIDLAENYRLNDMWMYSAHNGREFRDFVVDEYTVYSEDLFTCTISFTKRVVLTSNGQEKLDYNNQIYYFVNIDGEWLIAALMDDVD